MIDLKSFIDQNMNKGMKEALSKMPPKQKADVNRMMQSFGKSMSSAINKNPNSEDEVMNAYADFKIRLDKDMELHNKMQDKYVDNSNKQG